MVPISVSTHTEQSSFNYQVVKEGSCRNSRSSCVEMVCTISRARQSGYSIRIHHTWRQDSGPIFSSLPTSKINIPSEFEGVNVLAGLDCDTGVISMVNGMDEIKPTKDIGQRKLGKAHGDLN
jgi:hypothetical protein